MRYPLYWLKYLKAHQTYMWSTSFANTPKVLRTKTTRQKRLENTAFSGCTYNLLKTKNRRVLHKPRHVIVCPKLKQAIQKIQ